MGEGGGAGCYYISAYAKLCMKVPLNGHKNKIKIHFKKILSPDITTDFSTKIDLNT